MSDTPEVVSSGTVLSGADVVGSQSILIVSGGTGSYLSAGYAAPGGTIVVRGSASQTHVYYGGTESVLSGGTSTHTSLTNTGAEQIVGSAGVAIQTADGGAEFVRRSGTAISTTVQAHGGEVVSAGGVASHTIVDSGGFLIALPNAVVVDPVVEPSGALVSTGIMVYTPNSGFSSDTNAQAAHLAIGSGGLEYVLKGGDASATAVTSGGTQMVYAGGTATRSTVSHGGEQIVFGHGLADNTRVGSGGFEVVSALGDAVSTTIASGGTEVVSGGTSIQTTIAGGMLDLADGAVTSTGIYFSKPGGTLDIVDSSSLPDTVLLGFGKGDKVEFDFLTSTTGDTYSVSGDAVTISAGGHTYVLEIDGAQANGFKLEAGADGQLVIAVCYYPGTAIRTPGGEVAVERLAIGDDVVTAEGRVMPIRWIGRNTVSTRFADPLRVLPIRIRAGALGDNLPQRDLLVSPEHAVLVEDILVQAAALVNGLSILRERDVPEIFTYYHVELAEHALILAEGTPAESFVDNIHRAVFDNWDEHEALYGDAPILELPHPRALSYRQVPADMHGRLMARARMLFQETTQQVA